MAFIRFALSNRHPGSGVESGLFASAKELRDNADVSVTDRQTLQDLLAWFSNHLAVPTRFNRTSSKGHYRRNTQGIAWFRDTAKDHLARMHHEFQVVAEPFAETRTGPQ